MHNAAKHIAAFHLTSRAGSIDWYRAALLQALMRANPIVVFDVLQQVVLQQLD